MATQNDIFWACNDFIMVVAEVARLTLRSTPVVGEGATVRSYTDRHAYTVVAISKSGKHVTLQADQAVMVAGQNSDSGQRYEYSRDPNGEIVKCSLTQHGWRTTGSTVNDVQFNIRDAHHDYSF